MGGREALGSDTRHNVPDHTVVVTRNYITIHIADAIIRRDLQQKTLVKLQVRRREQIKQVSADRAQGSVGKWRLALFRKGGTAGMYSSFVTTGADSHTTSVPDLSGVITRDFLWLCCPNIFLK